MEEGKTERTGKRKTGLVGIVESITNCGRKIYGAIASRINRDIFQYSPKIHSRYAFATHSNSLDDGLIIRMGSNELSESILRADLTQNISAKQTIGTYGSYINAPHTSRKWRQSGRVGLATTAVLTSAFLVVMGFGIAALRVIYPPRESGGRVCRGGLQQIGKALRAYAQSNNGFFPPDSNDLGPLYPRYLDYIEEFRCPATLNDPRPTKDGKIKTAKSWDSIAGMSYYYVGGLTDKDDPNTIIAFDRFGNHTDGIHKLYLDARVDYIQFLDSSEIERRENRMRLLIGYSTLATLVAGGLAYKALKKRGRKERKQ